MYKRQCFTCPGGSGRFICFYDRGTATGPRSCNSSLDSLSHRLCSVDMCEVFSPPRVGKGAIKFGMKVGDAMDLTTGWDFNLKSDRDKAEKYIDDHQPLVVIGSPPCTPFSQLHNWSPDTPENRRTWNEGVEHMRFVVKLYRKQVDAGRAFLHEHLAIAKSWGLKEVQKMTNQTRRNDKHGVHHPSAEEK